MAMRCSTALVEPPDAQTAEIASSSDSRVMICEGFSPARARSITSLPASQLACVLFLATSRARR